MLVPFPFTDLSGNKVRPAIIISDGKIGDNVVVVFVTSKLKTKEKHAIKIKPSVQNGLKTLSFVHCGKIASLSKRIILGELGQLEESDRAEIDTRLRGVLGL